MGNKNALLENLDSEGFLASYEVLLVAHVKRLVSVVAFWILGTTVVPLQVRWGTQRAFTVACFPTCIVND